ncbi:hypothetical protein [Methyloterricola oryzae]|uniref:hypothetical protein n=1 Tax=Methyloterricola oryzae TaxID=1495050 RepID=UPI0005EBDA63|nr:hypothetical protein [Methyloterricola oryzae]
MEKISNILYILLVTLGISANCHASLINFDLVDLGQNQFRYIYTIENDGTLPNGGDVLLFDILFDPALYRESSLIISSDPSLSASWDQQILASAPGIPATFDALSTGTGIGSGTSLTGFAIDFIWLGTGRPAGQQFEIYDPTTFDLLKAGSTTSVATPVPLPASLYLMLSSLMGYFVIGRRAAVKS